MSSILITGLAGLFGSNFSRYLVANGYQVIGIDNFSGGYQENVLPDLVCVQIDLTNLSLLEKFFQQYKIDYIYHFAAYAAEGLSPFIRNFNYTNNLISSVNLINCAINFGVKKIIYTSSMAVYGNQYQPPFTENMLPSPIDPYGISKYAVEMDLAQAFQQFGLRYSIVRPHNVIGLYQNIWDRYRNVLGIWIRKCLDKDKICIFGDGMQKRSFSDIIYYHKPLVQLLSSYDSEIFNLGADQEITLLDAAKIVQKIAQKFGFHSDIVHLEERHEAKNAFSSQDKAKALLNFQDETDLEKTVYEMFAWAIKQKPHPVQKMPYEIAQGLYSYWR